MEGNKLMSSLSAQGSAITSVSSITPALSVYFDLVRGCAALIVMLNHYVPTILGGSHRDMFPGHDAVIVFFVLSGFVIAYVSDGHERTLRDFALSRLARLWSVAIPAAFLSGGAYLLVGAVTVAVPAPAPLDTTDFILKSFANVVFLGEGWTSEIYAPFNAPMWSLNYEAWYYAIFAGWLFFSGRARILVTITLCVLAGPRILTLIPCWLIGVGLYRWRESIRMSASSAYILYAISLALYVVVYKTDMTLASRALLSRMTYGESYHLGPSTSVLGDWVLAGIVAAHFAAVPSIPAIGRLLLPLRKRIAYAASYTLSIYLFHIPVLVIFYGYFGIGRTGIISALLLIFLCLGSIVLLARFTEHRRLLWRHVLTKLWPENVHYAASLNSKIPS